MLPLLLASGCFSSWAITQASGGQRMLDEGVREESLPLPGVHERLNLTLPLASGDFTLQCRSTQSASNTVYHSGFRYGKTFKRVTGVMFLVEAGIAAATFFAADRQKPGTQLTVGFFGLDALGTAALFFVPRKEVYREEVVPVASPIRSDCPDGLAVEIAGERFPVDAAGRLGELGEAALDTWMSQLAAQQIPGAIRVTYQDRVADLGFDAFGACTWSRARHQDQSTCPQQWSSVSLAMASIEVPMGTLTRADASNSESDVRPDR